MEKEYSLVTPTGFRMIKNRKYRLFVILFSFFRGGDLWRKKCGIRTEKNENEVEKTM